MSGELLVIVQRYRSSRPEVFLEKCVLKICSIFTGEHPCRSAISSMLCTFIEITLPHGCSPVNLQHIFRIPFPKDIPGWLLLKIKIKVFVFLWRLHFRTYCTWSVSATKLFSSLLCSRLVALIGLCNIPCSLWPLIMLIFCLFHL